jgi:hypothetical protein
MMTDEPPQNAPQVGIMATSSVTATITVVKHVGVATKGYFAAVERLRQAVLRGSEESDGVYIALVEAIGWLAVVEKQTTLAGNVDAQAVIFARNVSQHHLPSLTHFDEARGTHVWRPETQLPSDPSYPDAKRKPFYGVHLAGRPVLEVFDRLASLLAPR